MAALGLAAGLLPGLAHACACGCGVFDVGAGTMMPSDSPSGFTAWFRYSYMDQNQNWEGGSRAPAADNDDKKIKTNFYTIGGEYRINRDWSIMAELPFYDRALTTTDDGGVFGPAGTVYTGHDFAPGDLQLNAIYTGFAPDLSTGVSLGIKLPTGDFTGPNGPLGETEFDRDSLPGTGSTDLMIGAYHFGTLTKDGAWTYFVQGRYQFAVAERDSYRPGNEFDSAFGLTYNIKDVGPFDRVAPLLQIINSYRERDSGTEADALNSGYERLLIAPGVEVRIKRVRISADVAFPIYQHTNVASSVAIEGASGQLVAPELFKIQTSYDF